MAVNIKTEVVFPEECGDDDFDRENVRTGENVCITKTEVVEEFCDMSAIKNEHPISTKQEEEISITFLSEDSVAEWLLNKRKIPASNQQQCKECHYAYTETKMTAMRQNLGSKDQHFVCKKMDLVLILKSSPLKQLAEQHDVLTKHLEKENHVLELSDYSKKLLYNFTTTFRLKWKAASRNFDYFVNKNKSWLDSDISFPLHAPRASIWVQNFAESSERSKRRKIAGLQSQLSADELSYATQMSLCAAGKLEAAMVVKDVTHTSPARASKYRKVHEEYMESTATSTILADKALSMMVEAKLIRSQYDIIRSTAKASNAEIFPSYKTLSEAKKRCYPGGLRVSETCAEVNLQSLLNHTTQRIILLQKEVIDVLSREQQKSLTLISKWGCDGNFGHSEYEQKFLNSTGSDANMFIISVVPIQLICYSGTKKTIVWQNPRTSSPRFCRPLRVWCLHENKEITVNEVQNTEKEISTLQPTTVMSEELDVKVAHELLFTMVDREICNAVSPKPSTMRCYLCGATAKEFNNVDAMLVRQIKTFNLRFGLSILHAWIRMFECLLHLSYRLEIMKWQAQTKEENDKVSASKRKIQQQFKLELGLIVDKPKPGYGSSNDGNTARRFFDNAPISSKITGLDENIIKRFQVVLQTISCGFAINVYQFREYALDTARRFISKYPWYYMPVTVHKLLIHGPEVICLAILPIGQLSEEAQEIRNKDIKKFREDFAKKMLRTATLPLEDVFRELLISSDPYITSLKPLAKEKLHSLSKEVLTLLQPLPSESPEMLNVVSEDDDTGTSDTNSDCS